MLNDLVMSAGYNIPPPARAKFGVDGISLDQMDIKGAEVGNNTHTTAR
jgi:hypothetical protein